MKRINGDKLEALLSNRMESEISQAKLAGGEIMVFQSGKQVAHVIKGYKDALRGEKLVGNEMYRLASMTKPITGAAALIGVQNGWFNIDDKVSDYIPQFSDMDVAVLNSDGIPVVDHKAKSDLLIYQMLSHCNGIMTEDEVGVALFDMTPTEVFQSAGTVIDYVTAQPLAFDPGTRTSYCGYSSFDAIAHILEIKSGLQYPDFLQKYIFDPLGITDITFNPTEQQWARMSAVHDRGVGNTFITNDMGRHIFEGFPLTYTCAGAGLAGSIEDYAKFAQMLLGNGSYNGIKILSPEMIAEMKKPRVPDGIPGREPNDSWGLGVRVKVHQDHLPIGVFGWSGAYGTHFWVDQENEITALYMRSSRWYDSHGAGQMGIQFEKDVMSCLE